MTSYHNKEPNFLSEGVSCEAGRRLKKRSLLKVNEHFQTSQMPQMTPYHKKLFFATHQERERPNILKSDASTTSNCTKWVIGDMHRQTRLLG